MSNERKAKSCHDAEHVFQVTKQRVVRPWCECGQTAQAGIYVDVTNDSGISHIIVRYMQQDPR